MKKYIVKEYLSKPKEYIFAFLTFLIVGYFFDGRKFTIENLYFSITVIIVLASTELITFLIKRKKKN